MFSVVLVASAAIVYVLTTLSLSSPMPRGNAATPQVMIIGDPPRSEAWRYAEWAARWAAGDDTWIRNNKVPCEVFSW